MKLSMQMTVTDLIRTLRWRGIELCETATDAPKPVRQEMIKTRKPKR